MCSMCPMRSNDPKVTTMLLLLLQQHGTPMRGTVLWQGPRSGTVLSAVLRRKASKRRRYCPTAPGASTYDG